ncbi:hypothetical protein ACFL30_03185 [Candidatus Latescibacterota bacterium]
MKRSNNNSLTGKTLYIHPMTRAGARALAAVFRSKGVNACLPPPSDSKTVDLGALYTSGDECYPTKVTLGDYLKITQEEGFDPSRTAFMMPTANGPCRFGQYRSLFSKVFHDLGLDDVQIFSPSSKDGYNDIGGTDFFRLAWIAFVSSDIIRKMLLKTRPYEKVKGTTDKVYEQSLVKAEKVIEREGLSINKHTSLLRDMLIEIRDDFRAIDADYVRGKPLLAVVGEIFCRHNRFANENMIVKLEEHGAETWLADVSEWVFYTDWTHKNTMTRQGKKVSKEMAVAKLKNYFMKKYEHLLLEPFHDDFEGYEEPSDVSIVMDLSKPYLDPNGALGEMAMSLGRSGYCYTKGVDGIVDISPFSCMNGIVTEAVYPSFSKDHNNIPCRVFYYDGVNQDLDRDIGIFIELVKGYKNRKKVERRYNRFFD